MSRSLVLLACFSVLLTTGNIFGVPQTQTPSQSKAQEKQKVPVMDGGAGPCSLELTVTMPDGKPAYAATVKVHIAYGFAGARRLDLQAGTNSDGKVKFTGLPARVHRPPLEFQGTKDQLVGTVTYDPNAECEAKHDMVLQQPAPAQ
jgi:hypothetical protein